MSRWWRNRVVWSEGMFLQPQHLQQADRHLDGALHDTTRAMRPFAWGFSELTINRQLLTTGSFAITSARGILEDGTPFAIPDDAEHPAPLKLPEGTRDCIVYLTLPIQQPGGIEIAPSGMTDTIARFTTREVERPDAIAGGTTNAPLQVALPRFGYALQTDPRADKLGLGAVRIAEVRPDGAVSLDETYIPPVLACGATPNLANILTELQGVLHQRASALSGRVVDSGVRGVAEIADFLMLMAVNRFEPLLAFLAKSPWLSPYDFYGTCVSLAGELATFTARTRRPPEFAPYRHDDLKGTFAPVIEELRRSFSEVLPQTAIPLPLQMRKYGVWVSPITDRALLGTANFVLAVMADMPQEALRANFPKHLKIGPVEQIRELITVAMPGIPVRPLAVAPRQIPYHAGKVYFELDRNNEFWRRLANSGGFAMHLAGEFPGVTMDFWAIRESTS